MCVFFFCVGTLLQSSVSCTLIEPFHLSNSTRGVSGKRESKNRPVNAPRMTRPALVGPLGGRSLKYNKSTVGKLYTMRVCTYVWMYYTYMYTYIRVYYIHIGLGHNERNIRTYPTYICITPYNIQYLSVNVYNVK